jgi:hypothetical protein
MKAIVAALIAGTLLMPVWALARQPDTPLTRAQVREQIVQLEQVGYTPGSFDPHYPERIQSAQAKVAGGGKGQNPEQATNDGKAH